MQQSLGGLRAAETDTRGPHHQPNHRGGIPLGRRCACNPRHKPRVGTVFTSSTRKRRHSKAQHLVQGHRASWWQEWDLNSVSSSEVISKARACLGPQEPPPQPRQRVWVCRASRSPKPGQSWGRSPVKIHRAHRWGSFHASCHPPSQQTCEQGTVIVILFIF